MTSPFLAPDSKMLYKKAKEIKVSDINQDWFIEIINQMKNISGVNQHKNKTKHIMVGLAAPQIGYLYRIILVDLSASSNRNSKHGDNIFMFNPKIVYKSKKMIQGREGCYSTKMTEYVVNGIVERHHTVRVSFLDEKSQKREEEFSDFTSVIIQHEIDHLDGIVFVHKIKRKEDLHLVFPSEYNFYKENYKKWRRNLDPQIYFKDICKL